jgi:hypothetical protein
MKKAINLEMLIYENMGMTIFIKTAAWCKIFASRFQPELIINISFLFDNFGGLRNLQDIKSLAFSTNFTRTHRASLGMPTPAITGCVSSTATRRKGKYN